MTYHASETGTNISYMLYGVPESFLHSTPKIKKIFISALKADNFDICEETEHKFNPHGYTSSAILAESTASISTYIEYSSVNFTLSSCRSSNDGKKAIDFLADNIPHKSDFLDNREVPLKESALMNL